jgi:hypothetical protein
MSKIAERMPAIANSTERLALTAGKMENLVKNGRVSVSDLHDALVDVARAYPVNGKLLEEEGRRAIATQSIAQFTSQRVITIDRKSKTPVYQSSLEFADNWFKVGSEFVKPEAMTLQDFDLMVERYDHRIENATIDRNAWTDFRDRARPGLEAGQNLVEQFDAGTLTLYPADTSSVESGDQDGAD